MNTIVPSAALPASITGQNRGGRTPFGFCHSLISEIFSGGLGFGFRWDLWKARVILLLSLESLRFAQFRRALPGITQQVLSAQLKALQQSGIVLRIPGARKGRETPTYLLTRDGQHLVQALEGVASWGEKRLLAQGHRWLRPVGSLTQSVARALADSQ